MRAKPVLWAVDVQRDFMLPGGALYVPGAEKLTPNIDALVGTARAGRAFLVSSACQHTKDDPEFKVFPPHCIRGTRGAELLPEASTSRILRIPNHPGFVIPDDLANYDQILIEKQVLDVFSNLNTAKIVDGIPVDTEFFVFGVVTEYCVRCAVRGLLTRSRRVSIVGDAIETLRQEEGEKTISELAKQGAQVTSTSAVVERITAQMSPPHLQKR